ncbi:restriction endonuclease subunit S [Corynebacterium phoceense]|uniref:restriction endonuclease subunit S n=1 Tax=Corynebacterium phoceense TaxID=1686286 RepID=UPI00211CE2AE|nr:restriction endonuclease subunit S [Corynebacterium phoceense]MCQ9335030.1 restriction endonuclease subunit S [Corynebacterium phoceense]
MSSFEILTFHPMLLTDVFDSMAASKAWYDKSKLSLSGDPSFPFVSRTKARNGVDGFCPRQEKRPEAGNALTIGLDTQTIGYQPVPFYTSQNIQVLRHVRLNESNALVLASLIKDQMGKFSWGGNGATLGRLKKTRIMVPAFTNDDGTIEVDWDGMDRLGAELLEQVVTHAHSARETCLADDDALPELRFKPMFITDVFDSMKASKAWYDKVHLAHGSGQNLYLSQTLGGNSVSAVVADQAKVPESGNCITVTLKTQSTFYQPAAFYTAQNFLIFRNRYLNAESGVFLVTVMRRAMGKFSWGYGVSMARLQATRIMVPVVANAGGEDIVDWDGMNAYGRALRVRAERAITPVIGDPS